MSWGPKDSLDMWSKKREPTVNLDVSLLAYGPSMDLLVKKKNNLWYWRERKEGEIDLKVGDNGHSTFLEAVNDYQKIKGLKK